jgi:hypothetical protein
VAARSKALVYGRSPAAIVDSNPTWAWMFFCCVLLGSGLCDELITRPEESYRLSRVVVCDQETSCDEEAIARAGLQYKKTILNLNSISSNIFHIHCRRIHV